MENNIEQCAKALEKNGFEVYTVETASDARELVVRQVMEMTPTPQLVSYADSVTLQAVDILPRFRGDERWRFVETFNPDYSYEEKIAKRKEALLSDVFFTGANGVTLDGKVLMLDMIGNRLAPVVFAADKVFLFVGRNKISKDEAEARERIKRVAAPMNAVRHTRFRLACQVDGVCHNCSSPNRICNAWLIMEKCFPKKRVTVVLINQELGY